MNISSRRHFLKTSLAAGAAIGWSARSWASVAGANSAVRVATVGFRGRGKNHLAGLRAIEGVRYVGLCDVDREVLAAGISAAKGKKEQVTGHTDIRQLLERKDLDAITIATPNH